MLRVRSGDTVEIRSAFIDTPEALETAGVAGMKRHWRDVLETGLSIVGPAEVQAKYRTLAAKHHPDEQRL